MSRAAPAPLAPGITAYSLVNGVKSWERELRLQLAALNHTQIYAWKCTRFGGQHATIQLVLSSASPPMPNKIRVAPDVQSLHGDTSQIQGEGATCCTDSTPSLPHMPFLWLWGPFKPFTTPLISFILRGGKLLCQPPCGVLVGKQEI